MCWTKPTDLYIMSYYHCKLVFRCKKILRRGAARASCPPKRLSARVVQTTHILCTDCCLPVRSTVTGVKPRGVSLPPRATTYGPVLVFFLLSLSLERGCLKHRSMIFIPDSASEILNRYLKEDIYLGKTNRWFGILVTWSNAKYIVMEQWQI